MYKGLMYSYSLISNFSKHGSQTNLQKILNLTKLTHTSNHVSKNDQESRLTVGLLLEPPNKLQQEEPKSLKSMKIIM